MLQHLRQSIRFFNLQYWCTSYHVCQQDVNAAARSLLGYSTAPQQPQQQQQQPQADSTNTPLEDESRYLDSDGELTFFDEPLELQQQQQQLTGVAAAGGPQPLLNISRSSGTSKNYGDSSNNSSSSSSHSAQEAAVEGQSVHRQVKQSRRIVSHNGLQVCLLFA
jgi:hypothetical protein